MLYLVDWFFFLSKTGPSCQFYLAQGHFLLSRKTICPVDLWTCLTQKLHLIYIEISPSLICRGQQQMIGFPHPMTKYWQLSLRKQICGLSKNLMIFFVCVIKVWYKTEKNITFMLYVSRPHDHSCFGGNVCKAVHNIGPDLGAYKSGQSIVLSRCELRCTIWIKRVMDVKEKTLVHILWYRCFHCIVGQYSRCWLNHHTIYTLYTPALIPTWSQIVFTPREF